MPAVSKSRSSRHSKTPYARQVKDAKQSDAITLGPVVNGSKNIIENAANGLYRLVSWVFTSGEDLSKNVGRSASKVVHRERPQRSLTSQMEDGTLNEDPHRSESLLAPDLIPHYLGKTPLAVKTRRRPPSPAAKPAARVPSFDISSFKVPALPTPPAKRNLNHADKVDNVMRNIATRQQSPAGSAEGAFPQHQGHTSKITIDHKEAGERDDEENSVSENGSTTHHHKSNGRPSHASRTRRLAPQDWQTKSSTGILAAWRSICDEQDAKAQSESFAPTHPVQSRSRATSTASSRRDSMLWHSDISFSQHEPNLKPVPELDINLQQAGDRYWAPIRSFPMPANNAESTEPDTDMGSPVTSVPQFKRNQPRHSRQASLASKRRGRQSSERAMPQQTKPAAASASVVSSQQGASRRPTHAKHSTSRSASASREKSSETPKPQMVDSQVQTGDELMSFLSEETAAVVSAPPTVSKDRRKRPGCFSALDEDMEDLFGPYNDVPAKRPKLSDEEDEILLRPKIPLLKEDQSVKALRAQQQRVPEMTPQTSTTAIVSNGRTAGTAAAGSSLDFGQTEGIGNHLMKATPSADLFGQSMLPSPTTSTQNDTPKFSFGLNKPSTFAATPAVPTPATALSSTEPRSDELKTSDVGASVPKFDFSHNTPLRTDYSSAAPEIASTTRAGTDKAKLPAIDMKSSETQDPPKPTFSFGGNQQASAQVVAAPTFAFGKAAGFGAHDAKTGASFSFSASDKENANTLDKPSTTAEPRTEPNQQDAISKQVTTATTTPAFNFGPSVQPSPVAEKSDVPTNKFSFGSSTATSVVPSASLPSKSSQFSFPDNNATAKPPTFSFGSTSTSAAPPTVPPTTTTVSADQSMDSLANLKQPAFGFATSQTGTGSVPDQKVDAFQKQASSGHNLFANKPNPFERAAKIQIPTNAEALADAGSGTLGSNQSSTQPAAASAVPSFGGAGGFTFGSSAPVVPSPSAATTFSFGAQATKPEAPTTSIPSFGQGQAAKPTFGGFQQNNASSGFGNMQQNEAPKLDSVAAASPSSAIFGNTQANSSVPTFGAPATNSSTFSFGTSNTANGSSMFGMNNGAPVQQANNGFTFGQSSGNTAAPSAPAIGGNNTASQGFTFGGQGQSAPASGFASPVVQSPSLQPATAPGSPNVFGFGAPSSSSTAAPGGRRIAQPRTRRARGR